MPRRHRSRECALQVLYLMDAGGQDADAALAGFWAGFARDEDVAAYAETLVKGVGAAREELDGIIERRSTNWRVSRMAVVDRNILRLAVYEMRFCRDVPGRVVLDEAIELAKRFGSEESRAFVNGILDGILSEMNAP